MENGRIKTAIEFLKNRQSFRVGDLRLGIEGHTVIVTGWSQYIHINNISKHNALEELNEIKDIFERMIDESSELRIFIVNKKIRYNLYFDDYGKGSVIICSENNGDLKWEIELK
jgi:hypothetical protein